MSGPADVLSPRSRTIIEALPAQRRKQGWALAEGERVVSEALAGAWTCHRLFIEKSFASSTDGRRLAARALTAQIPVSICDQAAMEKLSSVKATPPVSVLLEPPALDEGEALGARVLVLDGVSDPANSGALIRSAAALGFQVVLCGGVRLANDRLIRASSGLVFKAGLARELGAGQLAAALSGHRVLTFDARAETALDDVRGAQPVAIVLGNEAAGVSAPRWPGAVPVRIPMAEGVESLNVAACGAIAMHQLAAGALR